MIGLLKGLSTTLKTLFRHPVTVQYPREHLPLSRRFRGFPGLTYDEEADEPRCVACMLCARNCPTGCITVTVRDNDKVKAERYGRKRIVDQFSLDVGQCMLCGICVEVCNFDAIIMSREHEMAIHDRSKLVLDKGELLKIARIPEGAAR